MNVFILNTGRCGSVTFIKACGHITNFTSGHETRIAVVGPERLAYPSNHIEADNRLSWFLGRLDEAYGPEAFYVHLTREEAAVARSFTKRYTNPEGIIWAYRKSMLMHSGDEADPVDVSLDYVRTVNANIRAFLKDKPRKMNFALEQATRDFAVFWDRIGAEGDRGAALKEFQTAHNASQGMGAAAAVLDKVRRVAKKLPGFLKDA